MAFTYILKCSDGSYYTGVTNDVQRRFAEHQQGLVHGYTHDRRPVELMWSTDDVDIASAIHTEKRIKGWRRAKKEALISGNLDLLPELSRAYVRRNRPSIIRSNSRQAPLRTMEKGSC